MDIDLYSTHFAVQKKHWWFVAKTQIVVDAIARYIRPIETNRILDAGCGAGLMLSSLEKYGQTYGMDISPEAIAFCRVNFKGQLEQGYLPDNVPYKNVQFDLITSLDVIEHIDDDVNSLKTLNSLLSPRGKLILTVPAYMFLWSHHDEINHHKRRYSLGELRNKLEIAGFKLEESTYFNTLLFPLIWLIRVKDKLLSSKSGNELDIPSPPVNFLLKKIFGFEKYLIRFLGLPFGVSILIVASRKNLGEN
jgi:SAM-dependent methyltransferase